MTRLLLAVVALSVAGCRIDFTGAPCARDERCPTGQVCRASICVLGDQADGSRPDDQPDGSPGDGGLALLDGGIDAGVDAGSFIGINCSGDGDCASGFCTDGVCCESRCLGACEACSSAGTCGVSDAGVQPLLGHGTCAPEAVSTCGRDGTCDGLGNSGVECAGPSCSTSGSVGSSTCDGFGQCNAPSPVECGSFVCADGGCPTSCAAGETRAARLASAASQAIASCRRAPMAW